MLIVHVSDFCEVLDSHFWQHSEVRLTLWVVMSVHSEMPMTLCSQVQKASAGCFKASMETMATMKVRAVNLRNIFWEES